MPVPHDGLINDSRSKIVGMLQRAHSTEEIRHEPMFFGATIEYAFEHGGPIVRDFITSLLAVAPEFKDGIIDSRSHMLMPGWFPCIPGWHHDDVPRPADDSSGQPDYINPRYRSQHILCLVGAKHAPTQFAHGRIHLPHVPDDQVIYGNWHHVVEDAVKQGRLDVVEAQEGALHYFDDRTLHQGVPAVTSGWRHFIRISIGGDRRPANEIRAQVQVYLPAPMAGW